MKKSLVFAAVLSVCSTSSFALDGGTLRVSTDNDWKAFEVISQNDNPPGDGFSYSMPGTFDGAGAWLVNSSTLRIQVNHETSDANISEVDLNLANLQSAISNMINNGNTGGVSFVNSARQAYDRWSSNGGSSWTNTTSASNTSFSRFCSAQAYEPDTFGSNRGFVDSVYITGEEDANGRLFALDSVNRDFYQLSGTVGSASGGIGGMSFDSWENAALVDTGETDHVALVLSPDGGSQAIKLYIGEKGKDATGLSSSSFLARNGLAYGSWYYLNSSLPGTVGNTNNGSFDTSSSGALAATKMEDVDTSPGNPTQVVLGNQNTGVFTLDFNLVFSGSSFSTGSSSFAITKISNSGTGLNNPDNVDWTAATTLGTNSYPQGMIFVNEDNSSGEIWKMNPDGSNQIRVGQTTVGAESTGIFDLSEFVGYAPGAVLISNNQGSPSSMTVLINPEVSPAGGNADPVAAFSFVTNDLNVSITDGSTDSDGTIVSWSWNFGDGASSTSQNPLHTYAASGTYNVTLTVTDNDGATNSTSHSVTMTAASTGWNELVYDDFENGWGNWIDGGSDAMLSTSYAIGSTSLNLQDNSSSSESRLANSLNLSAYSELKIEFSYVVQSFENTEDFWIRYSADGGSTWETVKAFINNVDFVDNGTRYNPVISINNGNYNFSNNVLIKIECDASGNRDDVYIDNIKISAQ